MNPIRTFSAFAPMKSECPLCHATLDQSHPGSCPRCDWVSGYRRHQEELKNTGAGRDMTAAVLSVLPGAGHFFKGHVAGGIAAFAGAIAVCLFVAGTVVATVGAAALLLPAYIVAVALHAYWAQDLAFARRAASPVASRVRPVPEGQRSR